MVFAPTCQGRVGSAAARRGSSGRDLIAARSFAGQSALRLQLGHVGGVAFTCSKQFVQATGRDEALVDQGTVALQRHSRRPEPRPRLRQLLINSTQLVGATTGAQVLRLCVGALLTRLGAVAGQAFGISVQRKEPLALLDGVTPFDQRFT